MVDCHHEPVQGEQDNAAILLIHTARLVSDHFLAQECRELLDFRSPELLREHEPFHIVSGTGQGLFRRQPGMFCNQLMFVIKPCPDWFAMAEVLDGEVKKVVMGTIQNRLNDVSQTLSGTAIMMMRAIERKAHSLPFSGFFSTKR